MDEIGNRASFDKIRYANCWEDAEILCKALLPEAGKRILSIASAGDNALALLSHGAEVVAADISESQIACVELRKEVFKTFEYKDCLGFLGIHKSSHRADTYRLIRNKLSDVTKKFWDNNPGFIEKGIIHTGKFERYFHVFRNYVLPLIHSKKTVQSLMRPRDRERRYLFYSNRWANRRWFFLFRIFFSRFVMGKMGRDPEFFRYVDVPVSERILERTRYALIELDVHENPYLDFILNGNYKNCLPYYLREDRFSGIRKNIENLELYHGSIEDAALHYGEAGFDGYNLSDIFEYIDEASTRKVYDNLLLHANNGARLAYWNMLVPRQRPEELKSRVKSLDDLAEALFNMDKAFFYSRFIVEEVR